MSKSTLSEEVVIKGVPISRGVAMGPPFYFVVSEDSIPEFEISPDDIEQEISRYQKAVERSHEDILNLQKKLQSECIQEGAEILDAQLQIMRDPLLTVAVETEIRHTKKNAEFVFHALIKEYQKRFQSIKDSFFRERFKDIQDICQRVTAHLLQSIRFSLADIPSGSIVIADELAASEAAEARKSNIAAFITKNGGATSHAAIVAKAKGIPFISSAQISDLSIQEISQVIVDGRTGEVFLNPSKKTINQYKKAQVEMTAHLDKMQQSSSEQPETIDGYSINLSANLEVVNDLDVVRSHGGHGIGLFRSEYIFLSGNDFPSEEAQYKIYKRIVKKIDGLPIVIRTFDVGGDKQFNQSSLSKQGNPFLGCRALRYFLNEKNILKNQLSAILRAAVYGEVSILFPMVSALSELVEAKALLEEVKEDLKKRGERYVESIRIGCMIEVPSAAVIADLLARECDFLSIGTNDLVQYSLAVDRGDNTLQKYYSPTHPAVIRLIKMVAAVGNHYGIRISVCGEVASDPRFTPLFLGLGIHELSLSSRFIPTIKNTVRNTSIVEASRLAEEVLNLTCSEDIMELLTKQYRENFPDDCLFNVSST